MEDKTTIPINVPFTAMRVREDRFEFVVYNWDEFTLDLLRKYADWKCNNGNKIDNVSNENKINNVDNKNEQPIKQEEDIRLAKTSEFGTPIYKSIVDDILTKFGKSFSKDDITDVIHNQRNKEITKSTAVVYAQAYVNYLKNNNLIIEKNGKFYRIPTEAESDWTAAEEDYLRENFYLLPFKKLCSGLNKDTEEVKEKAIHFFGLDAVTKRFGEQI